MKAAAGDDTSIEALRRLCDFGDPVYDNEGVCRRAGAERDVADRLWRALGFRCTRGRDRVHRGRRALELATEGLADLPSQSEDAAVELAVHEARTRHTLRAWPRPSSMRSRR